MIQTHFPEFSDVGVEAAYRELMARPAPTRIPLRFTVGQLLDAEDALGRADALVKHVLRVLGLSADDRDAVITVDRAQEAGLSVNDVLRVIALTVRENERALLHYAADQVELVCPVFETGRGGAPRVRAVVETTRRYADGKVPRERLSGEAKVALEVFRTTPVGPGGESARWAASAAMQLTTAWAAAEAARAVGGSVTVALAGGDPRTPLSQHVQAARYRLLARYAE